MSSKHEQAKQLGIQVPIIQAPMAGGATTPELVAAVSNAGGLGSLGAGYMAPAQIRQAIVKIRELTAKPFAVNLFIPEQHQCTALQLQQARIDIQACCEDLSLSIPAIAEPYAPPFEQQIKIIMDEKVPIFSFTFGILDQSWVTKLKANHTVIIGTATNLDEAIALEQNGVDLVVAQGSEAGGHRGTFIGNAEASLNRLNNLLSQLVNQLQIPVIAAGGIMDGHSIANVLQAGACAAQLGTAFLSCPEAGIPTCYINTLLEQTRDTSTLTRAFSGKLARGITNQFIKCMQNKTCHILDYPIQNVLTRKMRQQATESANIEFMSLWAGQGVHLSRGITAAQLIKELLLEIKQYCS